VNIEKIVTELEDEELLDSRQAETLHLYYSQTYISLHNELRLLLWLASGMLVSGMGLLIKDDIPEWFISSILAGSIVACFVVAQL